MLDKQTCDALALALIDLVGALNSPRQDDVLLKEAGVSLDRALFPLLVRIGVSERLSVAQLAEQIGRDQSTVSRQVAKMEALGLVKRREGKKDQRVTAISITEEGYQLVRTLTKARRRLLNKLLNDWSTADINSLVHLNRKLADAMRSSHYFNYSAFVALPSKDASACTRSDTPRQ